MSDAVFELDERQAAAVRMMCDPDVRVGILTGGPGRGKTTCLRVAIRELLAARKTIRLAAPTGKAARRMSEACEYPASTIHRMLQIGPDYDWQDPPQRIIDDVVIIDEASMLDTALGAALLTAIDTRYTRLFLVGDKDQLPSVGPGFVLGDLIRSGRVPVVELTTLHRAAAESWVARNAPRILAGDPEGRLELGSGTDFRWVPVEGGAEETAEVLLGVLEEELDVVAKLVGAHDMQGALSASQLLIPMKKGPVGVEAVNLAVQRAVQGDYLGQGGFARDEALTFYAGDKVLQTRNDYQLQTMNGETGIVQGQGPQKTLLVDFDDREVEYTRSQAWALELGFATTIHKSQGSEWPLVIVVCHSSHARMLSRQLIYTAVTRGKKRIVMVGDEEGLRLTLRNGRVAERRTGLVQALQGLV